MEAKAALWLVTIDLSQADLEVFERYEAAVFGLLPDHGGTLELGFARSTPALRLIFCNSMTKLRSSVSALILRDSLSRQTGSDAAPHPWPYPSSSKTIDLA